MIEGRLLPELDEWSAQFYDHTARGELRVQRCADCGVRRMPPGPLCGKCGSTTARWELLSGKATVWSFVVAHPPLLPAYAEQAPYNVVIAVADEDPTIRFCGNLLESPDADLDSVDHSSIRLGEPLRVGFPEPVDGLVLPCWLRPRPT